MPAIHANAVVFKSDGLESSKLLEELRKAVASLEDVPETQKDWHPGSDKKVLDLVHPSLFPLVYGRSQILYNEHVPSANASLCSGKGLCIPVPDDDELHLHASLSIETVRQDQPIASYSKRFQWLPCEVSFLPCDKVQIKSYINNLHPAKHSDLYSVIEEIISKVTPMWDAALTEIFKKEVATPKWFGGEATRATHGYYTPRVRIYRPEWKVDRPAEFESAEEEQRYNGWTEYYEDISEEYYSRGFDATMYVHDQLWERSGLVQPQPLRKDYELRAALRRSTEEVQLRKLVKDSGLQVIVKLANINLTPDSPTYDGGSWHVEGLPNEHMCASALLYYDNDNISDSYLAFRERVDNKALESGIKDERGARGYAHYDHEHMELLLGVRDRVTPAVQDLGHVLCKEGRLIVFPNVLQHRVEPFRLQDPSKPGHRKILALFLVDPYIKIPSTVNVPPQQRDWWADEIRQLDRIGALPPEIVDMIVSYAGDDLLTLDEAKDLRLELMDERSVSVDDLNRRYAAETFNFCEH